MDIPSAPHVFELSAKLGDPLVQQPTVRFYLCFARAGEKAKSAPLPLEVGPAPYEAATLVCELGKLNLQAPVAGACARSENLKN